MTSQAFEQGVAAYPGPCKQNYTGTDMDEWSRGWQTAEHVAKKHEDYMLGNLMKAFKMFLNTEPDSVLSKASLVDGMEHLVDAMWDQSAIRDKEKNALEKLLKKTKPEHSLCMYDPEVHPDMGERVVGGKERLFFWTPELLESVELEEG